MSGEKAASARPSQPGETDWDAIELRMGLIPSPRRIYEDGVEIWPGNHGKIPEGWDGTYPEKPIPPRSMRRYGRTRRR
ncbi:hypothetical protein [Subtercola sp. YIM 133946]|uniref:hypothetical protein n=1 Tax=Subtercola sp. YIM 133946 TaxID=3118909 RepID=UPI002F95CFBE